MDDIARWSNEDRKDLFAETAAKMHVVPAIAEKDFWVVWVLDKLFADEQLKTIFQFKGGTSLSKAFGLIQRFSEDIDLILDWRRVTDQDPCQPRSKNQQARFNEEINNQARLYIEQELLPQLNRLLNPICQCQMHESDGHSIYVRYPEAFKNAYLRPDVLLEIGPLAAWSPSETIEICSYAATYFPKVFKKAKCQVPTLMAKRTFWEKATILHQEAHRELDKLMPPRYSRHYYDMAMLATSDICIDALADLNLLVSVVDFKQCFYPSAWAKYDLAKPGSFRLLPSAKRFAEIKQDYAKMQTMLFGEVPNFEILLQTLSNLEKEINQLGHHDK